MFPSSTGAGRRGAREYSHDGNVLAQNLYSLDGICVTVANCKHERRNATGRFYIFCPDTRRIAAISLRGPQSLTISMGMS